MLADDTTMRTPGTDVPSVVTTFQSCVSDITEWTHLIYLSLNPTKTNYLILTTRQKVKYWIRCLPIYRLVISNYMKSVNINFLLSLLITISHGAHKYAIYAKRIYQSANIKHFLIFHARKTFFQAHIQSRVGYASALWNFASEGIAETH